MLDRRRQLPIIHTESFQATRRRLSTALFDAAVSVTTIAPFHTEALSAYIFGGEEQGIFLPGPAAHSAFIIGAEAADIDR